MNAPVHEHIPLFRIRSADDFDPGFIPKNYSCFKYGDEAQTENYSQQLYEKFMHFWNNSNETVRNMPIVVTGSAYKHMPVAATLLAHAFFPKLKHTLNHATYIKIDRLAATAKDFSKMNENERIAMKKQMKLKVDTSTFENGTHLVVVDDCKITGTHSINILETLKKQADSKITKITFLYIVELDPKSNARDQKVDSSMDAGYVCDIDTWCDVVHATKLPPTPRVLKYFLKWAGELDLTNSTDKMQLGAISKRLGVSKLKELWEGCQGDGYDKMPECLNGARVLESLIV
mmetsp:Transcript_45943/g.67791  ORF Transcript_45943/g.67791 Transcript_45943/m.67791 type:complete len:289 (-) Transcript_45943:1001-1867(-)|eukprot:CAMPEP_0195508626 /NCGR_PEP_ID=MMETSP0794_2-20130614/1778_1 /TAXON_ID=515487 /ORGANISM="Stephanopyxis turris, Strain CCMP 815" /LENGTH=288 /DNA_ID=CAMNT_0040635633 /DNA_START=173 /DNA_END=1039 /DNA_ORIENTATION=-